MHVDKFVRGKGKFLLQNTLQVTKKLTQSFRLFLRLEEYCHNTMLVLRQEEQIIHVA